MNRIARPIVNHVGRQPSSSLLASFVPRRLVAVASKPVSIRPSHLAIAENLTSSSLVGYRWIRTSLPVTPDFTHNENSKSHKSSSTSSNTRMFEWLDLNDAKTAYQYKSNWELVRAYLVFRLCQIPILVHHAEPLLYLSRRVLGNKITDNLLKMTLYGHFCAGENEEVILPVIHELAKANIRGIFDYAAESDDDASNKKRKSTKKDDSPQRRPAWLVKPLSVASSAQLQPSLELQTHKQVARHYDYESEARCDEHVEVFRQCIRSVQNVSQNGFAAIKVTALGNPELLARMSKAIVEAKNLFAKFDLNHDGYITKDEFETAYRFFFHNADQRLSEMLELLDPQHVGKIDYITWSKFLRPQDLPQLTKSCRDMGPLYMATPTDEELELIEAMFGRGHQLAEEAARCGTRLLVDAEQIRFQPAIDNLVLDLQQKYNATTTRDTPLIYHTYQCYLKDAPERLRRDVERSERFSYHFGAKLVRGAYLEGERAYAKAHGLPSPIHDTLHETHHCYNDSIKYLLEKSVLPSTTTTLAENNTKVECMCATHNQESIHFAAEIMENLGIPPHSGSVYFAQLYGMADHLTYNLGKHGYNVYKYVPYGQVKEVMPYLLRRAQENSAILGSATRELSLLRTELWRRMVPTTSKSLSRH